jgi:hypothetical protein
MAKSLYDQLAEGVGSAITDIRHKVVEEAWFGREVTGNGHENAPDPTAETAAPVESQNLWQEKVQQAREQAEKEPPAPDHGIER